MGILDKFKLNGKVAVITGSTRGLGKACAIALAEAGANVVITGTTLEPAEAVAAEIATANGVETLGLACDVRSKQSVDAMVDAILAKFGQLDIAFNNAGIATVGPAEDITEEQFDDLMAVNVKGVFLCTQAVGRVMLKQGSGSIINMASMSAHIVNVPQQISHYCASKAAVLQYSRTVAAEWAARGVRVNIIARLSPHRNGAPVRRPHQRLVDPPHPHGPRRRTVRAGRRNRLPRLRSLKLHDRQRNHHRWRLQPLVDHARYCTSI